MLTRHPGKRIDQFLYEERKGGEKLCSQVRLFLLIMLIPPYILRLLTHQIQSDYLGLALLKWFLILIYAGIVHRLLRKDVYKPLMGYLTLSIDTALVVLSIITLSFFTIARINVLNDPLFAFLYLVGISAALRFDYRYAAISVILNLVAVAVLAWFDNAFHHMPLDYTLIFDRSIGLVMATIMALFLTHYFKDMLYRQKDLLDHHTDKVAALLRISANSSAIETPTQAIRNILKESLNLLTSDLAYFMVSGDEPVLIACGAASDLTIPKEPDSFEMALIAGGKALSSTDCIGQGRSENLQAEGINAFLGQPLKNRKGIKGALIVGRRSAQAYNQDDQRLLGALSEQATQIWHYAKLLQELRSDYVTTAPDAVLGREGFEGMIGAAPTMQQLYRAIVKTAATQMPVLIRGESGTGKELIANALHKLSPRSERPFIKINCAAIAENLLESELFGFERGAFTGAYRTHRGDFELADGGTIFLDEIGDMRLPLQTKLLRVLQEGEMKRVGAQQARKVDVRVIAATNQPLEKLISEGHFREDLFFRISTLRIHAPALREHLSDLPRLVAYLARAYGDISFSQAALDFLARQEWRGNVRELRNVVSRSVVMRESQTIHLRDVQAAFEDDPIQAGPTVPYDFAPNLASGLTLRQQIEGFEIGLIRTALNRAGGNMSEACRLLAIPKSTLFDKIKRYNIQA